MNAPSSVKDVGYAGIILVLGALFGHAYSAFGTCVLTRATHSFSPVYVTCVHSLPQVEKYENKSYFDGMKQNSTSDPRCSTFQVF